MHVFDAFEPADKPTPLVPWNLRLASLKSARQTVARLCRTYAQNEIDRDTFKTLLFGLQVLRSFFSAEFEIDVEKRLQAIETAIVEQGRQ
jgi:hypothetical protein